MAQYLSQAITNWFGYNMRFGFAIAAVVVLAGGFCFAQENKPDSTGASPSAIGSAYTPVLKFDPKRDASADIQAAIVEARRTGKRVILDIGGDWCQYCHQMDQFFQQNREVLEFRDRNFVTVAINYEADNKQHSLAGYGRLLGIPHFFVLEKDGTLLYSQHVRELRSGGKYDPKKMKDFLQKWAPSPEQIATEH